MKYLFGPVNSRRLGLSLGIDLIPAGMCNYNCIYCEVNRPKQYAAVRAEYTPTAEIIAEISTVLANPEKLKDIDVFTITASGEPTLHAGLGAIIEFIKKKTTKPVTVLTNGGLLALADVRRDLAKADIVVPSLDAARKSSFQKINRPIANTDLQAVIGGLAKFREEFHGKFWLEVLLAEGINDQQEDINALKIAIAKIQPDKIQLNTVVRPPIEAFARPLSKERFLEIAKELGEKVEIIASFQKKPAQPLKNIAEEEILEFLKRRPGTESDLCEALGADKQQIHQNIKQLAYADKIVKKTHNSKDYWTAK